MREGIQDMTISECVGLKCECNTSVTEESKFKWQIWIHYDMSIVSDETTIVVTLFEIITLVMWWWQVVYLFLFISISPYANLFLISFILYLKFYTTLFFPIYSQTKIILKKKKNHNLKKTHRTRLPKNQSKLWVIKGP